MKLTNYVSISFLSLKGMLSVWNTLFIVFLCPGLAWFDERSWCCSEETSEMTEWSYRLIRGRYYLLIQPTWWHYYKPVNSAGLITKKILSTEVKQPVAYNPGSKVVLLFLAMLCSRALFLVMICSRALFLAMIYYRFLFLAMLCSRALFLAWYPASWRHSEQAATFPLQSPQTRWPSRHW